MEDIKTIVLSLIATGITTFFKWVWDNRDKEKKETQKFNKENIHKIKKEFYISLSIAVILILLPQSKYEFLRIGAKILIFMCLTLCTFAFMCLGEYIGEDKEDGMSDKRTDKSANKNSHKN